MPGGASSSPSGGCQAPFPSPCTGTRSPGATDLSGRDVSVLDADSQAGDEDALDFFQQQDHVEDEGLPTLGQQDGDAGKSLEEEEEAALDPLGIMRYVSPSGCTVWLALGSSLSSGSWRKPVSLDHHPEGAQYSGGPALCSSSTSPGSLGLGPGIACPSLVTGWPPSILHSGLASCHPNPDTSAAQAS